MARVRPPPRRHPERLTCWVCGDDLPDQGRGRPRWVCYRRACMLTRHRFTEAVRRGSTAAAGMG